MLFHSIDFLIFFPIVVGIYLFLPGKMKKIWLLLASYYFYMSWNYRYAALIAFSTLATFIAGRLLDRSEDGRIRKVIVAVSFTVNLGILGFFKYFDFLLENLNGILSAIHVQVIPDPFDIILPVGISFYTFQALGYTMDVYRGDIAAEKDFVRYALFVSFFPQLVAGPIERSGNLLSQIDKMERERLWDYEKMVSGFCLMAWGFFQKLVLSDRCAVFVDAVFDNLFAAGTVETVLAAVLFSLQIYCDFAGYSAIAIGAARVMGFSLMENFNTPYFALSIQDFWKRWHISLSSWFRDYLYIPLGGSRCSRLKKYRNLMITFLCSGLWHGASWTFVLWGGLHGCYQIMGDVLRPVRKKISDVLRVRTDVFSYRLGQVVITYGLTTFAWIFFRARTMENLKLFLNRMFTRVNPWVLSKGGLEYLQINLEDVALLFVFVLILLLADLVRAKCGCDLGEFLLRQNLWFRWMVLAFFIVCVMVFGEYGINFDSTKFIYFDF